jgi:hypothetical protein
MADFTDKFHIDKQKIDRVESAVLFSLTCCGSPFCICGGYSSSWGQWHETTSQTIHASRRSRRHATGRFEHHLEQLPENMGAVAQ